MTLSLNNRFFRIADVLIQRFKPTKVQYPTKPKHTNTLKLRT
jgi:hypothetical protein